MTHLLALGLGYTARRVADQVAEGGGRVTGSARTREKVTRLEAVGFDMLQFDPMNGILPEALPRDVSHLLISTAPGADGDPVLNALGDAVAALPNLSWIGYLSTIGVYGNSDGAWIDESAPRNPSAERGRRRVLAEDAWMAFGTRHEKSVQIFRLPGIYGPGRSPLNRVAEGRSRRIVKVGQVFNRAHVDDIANVLLASMAKPRAGAIYNVSDDEPAPPQDVIAFAAELQGIEPPPEVAFKDANMTAAARGFYGDSKRVGNGLIKSELGVSLIYPTYREGLRAVLAQERALHQVDG